MSTVEAVHTRNPTSNKVADVIGVLDHSQPELYRVEWESNIRNHDKTYYVEEFRFGKGPMMKLRGDGNPLGGATYLIHSNPDGRPKVIHVQNDGYHHEMDLVDLRILSEKFHWRLQVKNMANDIQRKLGVEMPSI